MMCGKISDKMKFHTLYFPANSKKHSPRQCPKISLVHRTVVPILRMYFLSFFFRLTCHHNSIYFIKKSQKIKQCFFSFEPFSLVSIFLLLLRWIQFGTLNSFKTPPSNNQNQQNCSLQSICSEPFPLSLFFCLTFLPPPGPRESLGIC